MGWPVLRFSTRHIMEETETYCVPTIIETINAFGGVDDGAVFPETPRR